MPAFDFKCGRCGYVANYVGVGGRGRTTFDIEYFLKCGEVAEAKKQGRTDLPAVECPYLDSALSAALAHHRQRRS
jgi:hypothetical protein